MATPGPFITHMQDSYYKLKHTKTEEVVPKAVVPEAKKAGRDAGEREAERKDKELDPKDHWWITACFPCDAHGQFNSWFLWDKEATGTTVRDAHCDYFLRLMKILKRSAGTTHAGDWEMRSEILARTHQVTIVASKHSGAIVGYYLVSQTGKTGIVECFQAFPPGAGYENMMVDRLWSIYPSLKCKGPAADLYCDLWQGRSVDFL